MSVARWVARLGCFQALWALETGPIRDESAHHGGHNHAQDQPGQACYLPIAHSFPFHQGRGLGDVTGAPPRPLRAEYGTPQRRQIPESRKSFRVGPVSQEILVAAWPFQLRISCVQATRKNVRSVYLTFSTPGAPVSFLAWTRTVEALPWDSLGTR